ncbi:MAG: helix-turn-helix domain-containing protein [Clostridium sp.]
MNNLNKLTKALLAIALVVSLTLNAAVLFMLKNQSERIDFIANLTNQINQNVSQSTVTIDKSETSKVKEEPKDIMTTSELAEYLNVDFNDIYKLVIDNPESDFPYIKINGEVRFSKEAVLEYMSDGNKILK